MAENSGKLIEIVDRLKPNAYSTEDKLSWISDVACMIRAEIIKYYSTASITTTPGTIIYTLPAGVNFEDVEYVYFNDKKVDKLDFGRYGITGNINNISIFSNNSVDITIVYLERFPRYRYVEYISNSGEITFGTNYIETIGEPFSNFLIGDTIEITGCTVNASNNKKAVIRSGISTRMEFDDNTFVAGNETGKVTIKRILNDVLLVPPPYDKMYKEYMFAMIDFNNREYDSYNNNMIMFNNTLDAFAKWYKQRDPMNIESKITNIW